MKNSRNNHRINALWIGNKLSTLEILTIQSYINKGHEFVLWAYDEIKSNLPEGVIIKDASKIIPSKDIFCYKYPNQFGHGKGSYAGFSDIFRYKLLYEKGGWWTDMDVCCLSYLNFEEDYVFRTHHSLKLVGNIMKCPPNSDLMKLCYEESIQKVTAENTDWHLPIQILINNVNRLGLDFYIREFSNPDSWDIVRKMLKGSYKIPDDWKAIHWVNEEWRRNNIDKSIFIKKSFFAEQLRINGIKVEYCKGRTLIATWFKLTKINFGINFLRFILKKIFSTKKH